MEEFSRPPSSPVSPPVSPVSGRSELPPAAKRQEGGGGEREEIKGGQVEKMSRSL